MGYMKNWELIYFERVARYTFKCCRRLCSPSSTWILQCSSPHVKSANLRNYLLRLLISFPRAEEIAVTVWFGAEPKNECESDQPMRAQLGSTRFPIWGRSSSFYTFFQDCMRGQHLCLAQVERSSSHTKTSEFWSLLTLFLR